MAHKNKQNVSPMRSRQGTSHQKPSTIYSQSEANDRMYDIFRNHNFNQTISHQERVQLAKFYHLLMTEQKKQNFTRLLDLKDIAIKHFMDCLIVPTLYPLQFPLLDVGTGPGFPGIPLKIHYPQEKIILAEGVQRRVEFLKQVREELQLNELKIIGRNINPFFAYPVRGVITRAVEDIRNTLTNVLTCLQTQGEVYFMKGPHCDPEIALAEAEMREFYRLEKDIRYTLPKTQHQRRLLVYRKIKAAPLIDFDEEPWPEYSGF